MDYKNKIDYYVTRMGPDRMRVEYHVDGAEYLSLYYERAKKGYVNKPIVQEGFACVEAKYSDGDIYTLFPGLTPKMLMDWGQEIVREATKGPANTL